MTVTYHCPSCGVLKANEWEVCGDWIGTKDAGYQCPDLICLKCGEEDDVYVEAAL